MDPFVLTGEVCTIQEYFQSHAKRNGVIVRAISSFYQLRVPVVTLLTP